jgi:hypothetical protein
MGAKRPLFPAGGDSFDRCSRRFFVTCRQWAAWVFMGSCPGGNGPALSPCGVADGDSRAEDLNFKKVILSVASLSGLGFCSVTCSQQRCSIVSGIDKVDDNPHGELSFTMPTII